ncbi:DUF3089 domain-containing protein [Sphingomonas sp.]|uniref:DUF3089 domain-containing protein n=1 Tax=Sphingomonas sp. TaxID=28214 RepID=UPI00286B09C0|nr:DUF3089 domain-containing protein [Sphingomonas sp.]
MIRLLLLAGLAVFATAPAEAQPVAAVTDYAKPANWLCLPGRADICAKPLPTTALNPNGYGSSGTSPVAKDTPIDCFYVYPTVSNDRGMNSDLIPDNAEKGAAEVQFARFAGVCRPFAPMYRQMTLGAVTVAATGGDVGFAASLAYSDVANAWRTYLAKYNQGRPFVLIGHSQGSLMLNLLIANRIEGKPEAARMKLAILAGFNVLVPQGKLVGGTFKTTPLCSRTGQTGCVISWVSFRENNAPPPGAIFGYADQPGMTVGCVNPARPGSRAWEKLDSVWYARSMLPVPGGPISWSSEGPPPTPYLRTEGLVSAKCVNDGPRGYLSIRTNVDPKGKRTDRIGGEVGLLGFFLPGWGMHLADIAEAQGDLIAAVGAFTQKK